MPIDFDAPEGTNPVADYLKRLFGSEDATASTPASPTSSDPTLDLPPAARIPQAIPPTPLAKPVIPIAPAASSDSSDLVKSAIAKKYGYGDDLDDAALKRAQAHSAFQTLAANLGQAGQDIGSAIARRGPSPTGFYDDLRASAATPVQNILQQRDAFAKDAAMKKQMEDQDPNSVKAVMLRKQLAPLAKTVGLDPSSFGNMGAADLKEFAVGPLEFAAKQKNAKDMKELQIAQINATKDATRATKAQGNIASAYKDTMNDDVVKKAKGQLAHADELSSLAQEATVNPTAANALATEAGIYISGGQRLHTSTMEAMGAGEKDIIGKLRQIKETGEKGTLTPENAAFMQKFIASTRAASGQTYVKLLKDRADSYSKIYGIEPEKLYSTFGVNSRMTQSTGESQDPKITSWATEHNLPYSQAASILKGRGYGQ